MSNEPVVFWGTLGTLIGALLLALMQQYMPDVGGELTNSIVDLAVFIVPVLGGLYMARARVTPIANPKDNNGTSLVPIVADPEA